MLALLVATLFLTHPGPDKRRADWPQAECKSAFGLTVCGYDCTAAFGSIKCAQTPYGKCVAAFGSLTCSDPSKKVLRGWKRPPQMQCASGFGQVACGYNCVSGFGEVKCAEVPNGRCEAAYGKVTCFDPKQDEQDPKPHLDAQAECLSRYGKSACGYGCVAAYGEIKCANNPNGTCTAAYGEIVCSE